MTDMRLDPPASLSTVSKVLEDAGFEPWAVGGAVRDSLLGIGRSDWDLATNARPEEVLALFRRTVPLGIDHGTVGVLDDEGVLYEVTTFRKDVETDGRHAVVAFADTIEEDLGRRDFTINAIAWREATDELRDPWGGQSDLAARVLRAVGDPAERFAEDYLRVLRGLRFAGAYELSFDPPTREALELAVPGLKRLSAERVREELIKVLRGSNPSVALDLYRNTGALEAWYPELAKHSETPAWDDALASVDAAKRGRWYLRLCRLLVVIPQGEPGVVELLERLKLSKAEQRRIRHLWEHYMPFVSPIHSSAEIREWLSEIGPGTERDLFRLHFADGRASGSDDTMRALAFSWRRVHAERTGGAAIELRDLAVNGTDVLELGLAPGPLVSLVLDELHAQVLEDPELNTRDLLLEQARELIKMAGLIEATDQDAG
jgi:tRNA nucleotidyltransferase (CCA-adding enzyme)